MPPPNANHWTTDPEYNDLLNYLIEKAKNAEAPMSVPQMAREFKEKSGAAQTEKCFEHRIYRLRTRIPTFAHIDTNTKVYLLFALSASVDPKFLKKLKKDALVEVDDKKRITHFKANDGSLELKGDHSQSAKQETTMRESDRRVLSLIRNFFENKNNADAVPKNEAQREMWNLIEFITEKCENVKSPLRILRLATDFNKKFGTTLLIDCIKRRIERYGRVIQKAELLDTHFNVKQLFGLSATLDSGYLRKLRTEALVEIDEKNRITYYKANDGSLELRGDHSRSAKARSAQFELKRSHRSLIFDYFENKDNSDAVPKNEEEKEMWNLIDFITEKCKKVDSPLNSHQLARDFNKHFGVARPMGTIAKRIRSYCREIQKTVFLDTQTKVKQLFGLNIKLNSDYLKELRKTAVVEVDQENRIIKYTANDGSLTLQGSPYGSKKAKPKPVKKTNKDNVVTMANDSEEESDNDTFNDSSDEYSSEEFGSEFDSDDGNNDSEVTEDLVKSANEATDFDNETPVRNRSPTEMSTGDNLDFDSPTERSHRSEDTERSEDEENNPEIIGNASVKTRYGRLSKKMHMGSKVSYNKANSSSSEVPISIDSLSPKSVKQKKQASRSSNQSRSSSRSMRRSARNSSFPPISTDSEEKMESEDAPRAVDCDDERSMRNGPPTEMSIDKNFDFDPPTERSHRSEEIEMREEEEKENDAGIAVNPIINKKYKRSERRYSDSEDDSDHHPEDYSDEHCSEDSDNEFSSNEKNDHLDETTDLTKPSNKAYDSDKETPVRSLEHSGISIDDNFDFDPPTERSPVSEEIETREDGEKNDSGITENAAVETQIFETIRKSTTSSSTSHTPKTSKRKADASAGSSSSKRTKAPSDKSMNPGDMNDNCSHDDPPRIELKPFRGLLELPKETQKDSDIQQISKPRPQVMKAPIKKEYEEEAHTSLKMILNAFKSLILSLDTPGLSQFLMELDKKIMEAGRRIEISNKEVILAMELLIVKLAKIGALKSSDDSISLREILSMLRTIILTLNFNGFEVILEMLKVNIEQLKVEDKKVPVSKAECVLRAILDIICT